MSRYWISWWQPGSDPRPLHFPPKDDRVLGWWRTGSDGQRTSVCAVVAASVEWTAKAAVAEDWPESVDAEWRFVEQKTPDWTPGDRFPPSRWMVPRLAHVSGVDVAQAPGLASVMGREPGGPCTFPNCKGGQCCMNPSNARGEQQCRACREPARDLPAYGVPVVDERQQFEVWMRREHPRHSLERTSYQGDHGHGDYVEGRTHEKWQTWQAARAHGVAIPPGGQR